MILVYGSLFYEKNCLYFKLLEYITKIYLTINMAKKTLRSLNNKNVSNSCVSMKLFKKCEQYCMNLKHTFAEL